VVSTGGNFEFEPERYLFRMIETHILPAVVSEAPPRSARGRME
jgi:hypothetical protein